MKLSGPFKFKQFSVEHDRSSLKVGVDAVLIGAWGDVSPVEGMANQVVRGLDIGCGCGVIALMMAQRNLSAVIDAIDIDRESVVETIGNFVRSPWNKRLTALQEDAEVFAASKDNFEEYDFIFSNPPFFQSGIKIPHTPRERARHESSLGAAKLIEMASVMLKTTGVLSMIVPIETSRALSRQEFAGMKKVRECVVADRPGKDPKRVMLSYIKNSRTKDIGFKREYLFIRDNTGEYSDFYKSLTKDFYLNF